MPKVAIEKLLDRKNPERGYSSYLVQLYDDGDDVEEHTTTVKQEHTEHGEISKRKRGKVKSKNYREKIPYTFKQSVLQLTLTVKSILDKIYKERERPVGKFVIGKTYARKLRNGVQFDPMKFDTWRLADGVNGRWRNMYDKEGYDGLVVLCAVTKDLLPRKDLENRPRMARLPLTAGASHQVTNDSDEEAECELYHQQHYILALEQQLIHYFAYVEQDPRLGNISVATGGMERQNAIAGVLYVAFKLQETDEE